jgi:hypothetical protein
MAEHGGYRKPDNPAPASGPGALSRRTDGGPGHQPLRDVTGLPYGQNQELNDVQRGAPLAATETPGPSSRRQSSARPGPQLTPFNAPTQQPDVPVTAGAAAGPGPGPEALGGPPPDAASYGSALSTLQSVAASSGSAEVEGLLSRLQTRS